MSVTSKAALPLLVAASLLAGCATHSDGSAPLNQRTWPLCSVLGGLVLRFTLQQRRVLVGTVVARHQRHTGRFHQTLGLGLEAHRQDR